MTEHAGWTQEREDVFVYALTRGVRLEEACSLAGWGPITVHELLRRGKQEAAEASPNTALPEYKLYVRVRAALDMFEGEAIRRLRGHV